MEEKQSTYEISELKINRKNILNWLMFVKKIYPLTEYQRTQINKFVKTRYTVRRDKLLDEIFGGEDG